MLAYDNQRPTVALRVNLLLEMVLLVGRSDYSLFVKGGGGTVLDNLPYSFGLASLVDSFVSLPYLVVGWPS